MNDNPMSALDRKQLLKKLQSETFDLLVIGGGATGTGIALDAASRGLKTALVEKEDFASGTSSKSTKLIHGGLRYLAQLDVGLVRETGTERAIVHRLAPHIVLPEKMLMPIVKGGSYGYWMAYLGLTVYDVLANVKGDDRRKMLNKKEALELEPLLSEDKLEGGVFYAEYRTDDARLTIELAKTAVRHGATVANYCKAVDFLYEDGEVVGVKCKNELTNKPFEIRAKKVVGAGGPWVDILRKKDKSLKGKRLHLTKGVHLVVPYYKFPLGHTVYFDIPDGRMIFAIPRGKTTYIGTTDTTYKADLNRIVVTKADAEYILNAVNATFPSVQLSFDDLISNWAGLRPLIHEDGKSPSELSRKDEIFESDTGFIAIAGGKLTGYRKMAQRVVDLVIEKSDLAAPDCKTKNIPLTPDPLKNAKAVEQYIKELEAPIQQMGLDKYYAWYLATVYGKQADGILEKAKSFKNKNAMVALARAEVWFTVHHEMVNSAADFFVRRTGRLYFDIESIPIIRKAAMKDLQQFLGWNESRLAAEESLLDELIKDATYYYESELVAEKQV